MCIHTLQRFGVQTTAMHDNATVMTLEMLHQKYGKIALVTTVVAQVKKMDSEVEMDRKPTGATAASHPNYTAVTQGLNQTTITFI